MRKNMAAWEDKLARTAPASSPKHLDLLRAACSDYGRAQEHYRENERRNALSPEGREKAQELARDMRICSQ